MKLGPEYFKAGDRVKLMAARLRMYTDDNNPSCSGTVAEVCSNEGGLNGWIAVDWDNGGGEYFGWDELKKVKA